MLDWQLLMHTTIENLFAIPYSNYCKSTKWVANTVQLFLKQLVLQLVLWISTVAGSPTVPTLDRTHCAATTRRSQVGHCTARVAASLAATHRWNGQGAPNVGHWLHNSRRVMPWYICTYMYIYLLIHIYIYHSSFIFISMVIGWNPPITNGEAWALSVIFRGALGSQIHVMSLQNQARNGLPLS